MAIMGLLPKDYDPEQVSSSNSTSLFTKLLPGGNKVRILDLRLLWQTWGADGKPIRYRANVVKGQLQKPKHLPFCGRSESKFGDEKWKHVWYALVWSYSDNDFKILEITQATVQKQLSALDSDADWGSLDSYDVKIVRTGEKMETEYSVIGVPPKTLVKNIKDAFDNTAINMDAIVYCTYPDDPYWADKAVTKLIDNLDKACKEAAKRDIDFQVPATTDLSKLQTAWERALDLMPLEITKLPKVADSLADELEEPSQEELTGIPF